MTMTPKPPSSVFDCLPGAEHSPRPTALTEVHMIWVRDGKDPDGTPWIADAWDERSIIVNHEGWDQSLKTTVNDYGGDNVRVAVTTINIEALEDAFKSVRV